MYWKIVKTRELLLFVQTLHHPDCSILKLRLMVSHYPLPSQRQSDWYSKNIKANFSKSMWVNIRLTEINTIALVLLSDSLGALLVYLIWMNTETLCYSFVPNKTCDWSNLEALFSSFWVGKQFEHSAPHSEAEVFSIFPPEMEKWVFLLTTISHSILWHGTSQPFLDCEWQGKCINELTTKIRVWHTASAHRPQSTSAVCLPLCSILRLHFELLDLHFPLMFPMCLASV